MFGLRMLLSYPEVATRSCDDCKKWLYNDDGGRVKRCGMDVPRHSNQPTPCHKCPKKSPEEAHKYELSLKNQKAVQFHSVSKAVGFRNLTPEMANDPILQRNFAIIGGIEEQHDRDELAKSIGGAVPKTP